ncbi:hypothetical protein SAMN04488118_106250 [Epibacterium ulvae]|uniref:Uncharacterized protein n=1 Tax=Epibacterium ulvae TaxID=1156985 RepID=A0A1G5QYV2_9RHOB|nr:hypothetical protein SAMN04488118_106250 [Epibacterium ulvae]
MMRFFINYLVILTLTRFEFALGLVDHIYAALATHNAAITVPVLERAERVLDFHSHSPVLRRANQRLGYGCRDLTIRSQQ